MDEIAARFATRFEPDLNSGCWIWSGSTTPFGYGIFKIAGVCSMAHRASWYLHRGPLPVCVCHKCDTPACVNPQHLFAGNWQLNNADRHLKGRSRGGANKGERSPLARLTSEQVQAIRATDASVSQRTVAEAFGVSQGHVSAIRNGKKWAGQ